MSSMTMAEVEHFAPKDRATARFILVRPQGGESKRRELYGDVSVLDGCSLHLNALLFSADVDAQGFADALPGSGYELYDDSPAAWRRFLGELHGTPWTDIHGHVAAPPFALGSIGVLCCCAPSRADVHLLVGQAGERSWELLCCGATLMHRSEYFQAAFRASTWAESAGHRMSFECEPACAWRLAISYLHQPDGPHIREADIGVAADTIALSEKYLFTGLTIAVLQHLLNEPSIPEQLANLAPEAQLLLAWTLQDLGQLRHLIGPWCIVGGRIMAEPALLLLEAGGALAETVLTSRAARTFLASREFLEVDEQSSTSLGIGSRAARLAAAGCLEVLHDCRDWCWLRHPADVRVLLETEELMPLLQFQKLRQELQHPRFCDVELMDALEPFPVLFDHLLNAWFKNVTNIRQLPHAKLSAWASCARFRKLGFLESCMKEANLEAVMDFVLSAPLHEPDVARLVQSRLNVLIWAGFCKPGSWTIFVTMLRRDGLAVMRRLVEARVLHPVQSVKLLATALLPVPVVSLRIMFRILFDLIISTRSNGLGSSLLSALFFAVGLILYRVKRRAKLLSR
mmetsp:Transcript_77682/g.154134  ORF Transcript_77682/g.154134 Transcript_77682/m.154134 type:complete len:571 (-) Transcript_77682:235-1947(-)